ncbi:hypothetical protein PF010_g30438, partial [Phytophthora fragariae]
ELARPPTIPFLNLQLEGIPATHVPLDVIKENLHGTGSPNRSESESARGSVSRQFVMKSIPAGCERQHYHIVTTGPSFPNNRVVSAVTNRLNCKIQSTV